MDIREMRYFTELAKTKNMTKAAQNLYISQPALHKALRKLEAELNTTLFYRQGNEFLPTDTGIILLENSKSILNLVARMEDSIAETKNLKRGKVHLGFPTVVGNLYMPDLLIKFQQIHPNIALHTTESGGAALAHMVTEGELDMAIIMRPVYSDALNEIPIIKNQMVACVNKSHPWASRNFVTIRDFKDVPFVTFDENFNIHTQLLERFRAENIQPDFALTSSSSQFLYKYATLSNSILILPIPMIELYCKDDPIKMIPFSPTFPWELSLIFRKNVFLSTAAKALINFIQEYIFQNSRDSYYHF